VNTVIRSASVGLTGVLLAMAAASTPLAGAGKPKAQDLAASAQFRCNFEPGNPSCPDNAIESDRIRDDGGGAYDEFNAATTEGASLNVNGEFFLNFIPGDLTTQVGRYLSLDFRRQIDGSVTYRTFQTLAMANGYMRTNTLAADGVTPLTGGLLGIPCGDTAQALLLVTFPENASRTWVVRFNPLDYPTSNNVVVTRHTGTSWTIATAPDAARAVLVSRTTVRNKVTIVNEGTYVMPFSVTVNVPGAPVCP